MNLTEKKCVACEGGTPPLTGKEITTYLKEIGEWEVQNEKKLRREFKFKDFKEALTFANRVGEIAEREGHHPDMHISWGKVIVELWTHAIGGLSENDFIVAAKIDKVL